MAGVDLSALLTERVREVARNQRSDFRGRALAAAIAPDSRTRCFALLALAAELRREGDRTTALAVLDTVVALRASEEVERAAYTVAIAVHTDNGDLDLARKLAEQTSRQGVDRHLLSAMARLYRELYDTTRLEEFRVELRRVRDELGSVAAVAP